MSTATPMLCAHCGRPMQSFVQVGSFWYHPECAQSPYAAPQPAAQPEPSCGWAGCPHGAKCVHAKQPEPGGLTDFQRVGLEELAQRIEDANETPIAISPSAAVAMRALLATTRKRSDEEVARIMEAVDALMDAQAGFVDGQARYSGARVDAAYAEVERLLKGEA